MKSLGIHGYPIGHGRLVFGEKFLLTSEESEELTKDLRKTGMDEFKGKDIPKALLPKNIPGNPLNNLLGLTNPNRLNHSKVNSWQINYSLQENLAPKQDIQNINLYPQLNLSLDSSEEGEVLSVKPLVTSYLDLTKQAPFRTEDIKNEFIDLVELYVQEKSEKLAFSRGWGEANEGWHFAPISQMYHVLSEIKHIARNIGLDELEALASMREFARDYQMD